MARTATICIIASLLIAAATSVAAVTPLHERSRFTRAAAVGACYLDWPISKVSSTVPDTWQGLALFTESPNCRGVSPNMPRIFGFQALWSAVVYAPIFVGLATVAQRIRRRKAAR